MALAVSRLSKGKTEFAVRHAHLFIVVASLWGCGTSTLEMSGADRGGLTGPSVVKGAEDGGTPAAVDAGIPESPVDAGTPMTPVVDAGRPAVCEVGDSAACTTTCGSNGLKGCIDGQWSSCGVPAESCDNGIDDDCDGQADHHDPECTPIVHTCEGEEGGGCNGDPGYGDRCAPADNENGCSAGRFHAWCNRRNSTEFPNIWYAWVHDWVSTRCDGTTAETGTQYSTWFCRSSTNDEYRCTTPLVLSFDNAPVRYDANTRLFPFKPGSPVQSDWPAVATPWLVRDVNGNGRVDDGSELFGSNTKTAQGVARHGFEALAALDANGDGLLDGKDPEFHSLLIWRDGNGDRVSQPSELTSLAEERVDALGLRFSNQPRCDLRGNCERERSTFSWRGADGSAHQGSLVDVYLRVGVSPVSGVWGR